MILPPPSTTLFPYTTLFRSRGVSPSSFLALENRFTPSRANSYSPPRTQPPAFHERIPRLSPVGGLHYLDRKSTRLNSSHPSTSYAVFCLKKNRCGLLT